jgi:SAM-dependent methyltransferase
MEFEVPARFLRNAASVLELGPPADVGVTLLDYMCRRIGIDSLAGLDVLDLGCGTRFADSIINRAVMLRSYTGIDIDPEMVAFLQTNVSDPRLDFRLLDARNPGYNPGGTPLGPDTILPVDGRSFDVICMFSVITHQLPDDAAIIFSLLRRHVRPQGWLFFSARIDDSSGASYREHDPGAPTALSIYSSGLLYALLAAAGWQVVSMVPANPDGLPILDSLLCRPAPVGDVESAAEQAAR